MKGPIYVWRYVLKSRAKLNAVSGRREFEGALLRIGDGFACLHPWPELGEPPLGELLIDIGENRLVHPQVRQAVSMSAADQLGRSKGMSLRDCVAQRVPESHATLPECTADAVEKAVRREYSVVKIKGSKNYPELAGKLDELSRRWPAIIWRIDFNGVLTTEEAVCFAQCLTDHAWKRIDFIEDPTPWHPEQWAEIRSATGLKLALDRGVHFRAAFADVLVIKPARDCLDWPSCGDRIVLTSNMDHPLGQCFAAWWAAKLKDKGENIDHCGLQTHELFEPTEFSERLGQAGPRFNWPGGTGLGFDDLLEKLPWKRLK